MSPAGAAALLLLSLGLLLRSTDCLVVVADSQTNVRTTSYRLADHVRPVHYSLTLAPFFYTQDPTEFYFTGSVRIFVRVVHNTSSFQLHSEKLFIHSLKVLDSTGDRLTVRSIEEDTVREWQNIILDEELQAGKNYTVVINRFVGYLRPDLQGIYLDNYTESGVRKYLVASQLEATHARKAFPCFDEPAFKATFDVSLVRRQDFKAISNMPSRAVMNVSAVDWFLGTEASSERLVLEDFETTPIMSTYLLAFVVSQFECIQGSDSRGRRYRTCARPEALADARFGLSEASRLNEFFEGFFQVASPLGQIGQVAVPTFYSSGMENWGLILYKEAHFIYNATWSTAASHVLAATLVSHEVAHQWFGNLVTMAWWNELWLNEAFVSFFGYFGAHKMLPDWDALFVSKEMVTALAVDSLAQSHPVEMNVQSPKEILDLFDAITYSKGGSIVRMMHNALGQEAFRAGLSHYLRRNSYTNTGATSLYHSLTRHANLNGRHLDVGEVMERWIKQVGYPVVSCSQRYLELTLSQQRFLRDRSQTQDHRHPSPFNNTWIIPITMATKNNASRLNGSDVSGLVHWMREKSQTFPINNYERSWYLLNLRSTGFYRVNYDRYNWNALTLQLLSDRTVFSPHDRARLLDDSFALANAGYIEHDVALRILQCLAVERHLVPWKAASVVFLFVPTVRSPRIQQRYRLVVNFTVAVAYEMLKAEWPVNATSEPMTSQVQGIVTRLACLLDLSTCRADAARLCHQFVASNFSAGAVPPELRATALCVGMVGGGANATSNWRQLRKARDAGTLHAAVVAESARVERAIARGQSVTECLDSGV